MKKLLVSLITLFLFTSCGPFTVRHFKTENLAKPDIASLSVSDTIKISKIDGEPVGFGSIGGDYTVHLLPGEHTLEVSYYNFQNAGYEYNVSSTETVTLKRTFQKGRSYYLTSSSASGNKRMFAIRVYVDDTFIKGIQPLPVIKDSFWSSAAVKTEKDTYNADENITIFFRNLPGNQKDWITIVPLGAPEDIWGNWKYIKGNTEGSIMFSGQGSGQYEVRVYYNYPEGGMKVHHRYPFTVR